MSGSPLVTMAELPEQIVCPLLFLAVTWICCVLTREGKSQKVVKTPTTTFKKHIFLFVVVVVALSVFITEKNGRRVQISELKR